MHQPPTTTTTTLPTIPHTTRHRYRQNPFTPQQTPAVNYATFSLQFTTVTVPATSSTWCMMPSLCETGTLNMCAHTMIHKSRPNFNFVVKDIDALTWPKEWYSSPLAVQNDGHPSTCQKMLIHLRTRIQPKSWRSTSCIHFIWTL